MKRKYLATIVSAIALSTIAVGATQYNKSGASDEPPIIQEVKHQGEVLDNHETRITNTENDVKDLQDKTSTPPSINNKPAPAVVTPSPAVVAPPTPTPAPVIPPVTVTSFLQVPVGDMRIDCTITYSDGTTNTWMWQQWEFNQGTKITHTIGKCDSSIIGKTKVDSYTGY
jgi:hypothetical protein